MTREQLFPSKSAVAKVFLMSSGFRQFETFTLFIHSFSDTKLSGCNNTNALIELILIMCVFKRQHKINKTSQKVKKRFHCVKFM